MINNLVSDSVLRVGEVYEVSGRTVVIKVDRNKNLSDIFFNGDILKNISVNSYIEIRKGFLGIIGKVEGERIEEERFRFDTVQYDESNRVKRFLVVSLSGYLTQDGKFVGGTKELPLIGNEAFIVTKEKIHLIHSLVAPEDMHIDIARSDADGFDVKFPVDGLFNSHIAVFGNTGSGKSNTLASLYGGLMASLEENSEGVPSENPRFILFDFNGEYVGPRCITAHKTVWNLSTRHDGADRIPIDQSSLTDLEVISILSDATDKTQKPFLKRMLSLYKRTQDKDNPLEFFKSVLKGDITRALQMSDKVRAFQIIDYLREILPPISSGDSDGALEDDLVWHNTNEGGFKLKSNQSIFLQQRPEYIPSTNVYRQVERFLFDQDILRRLVSFMYLQLIKDLLTNRAQNEHIAPVINKLMSKMGDIDKIFDSTGERNFWEKNFVVINLNDVNLDMKKTVPLLLSKKLYSDHKMNKGEKSLSIIIDEAHNILSHVSSREAESWKDYRLETFEEIIKEGRKFGVFVTISSQRPNDISPTITSQAHNYFIHRLINQKDLDTISSAVSYVDRATEESIPTLPTGTCIFSGIACQVPLKINVRELEEDLKPQSKTLRFKDIVRKAQHR